MCTGRTNPRGFSKQICESWSCSLLNCTLTFCASASLSLVQSPGTDKKKRKGPTDTFAPHIHTAVTQISPEGLPNAVDKIFLDESKCFLDLWDMGSLTKLCDLIWNPEQSFYYIIEDEKINRSSCMWPRQARLASILRVCPLRSVSGPGSAPPA